jgi:hypothetical protein
MENTAAGMLVPFEPPWEATYAIEDVARFTGISRHRIAVYCRCGIVVPLGDPGEAGWRFTGAGIAELRRAEDVRARVGDNVPAIRLLLDLAHAVERLERELARARPAGE